MDLLLHPADERGHTRPHPRGRLSTIGHREAFRAFAEAARAAGIRFMVIGGTFRDVAVRSASTRDIDVVLIDRKELDPETMKAAGFSRVSGSPHAWRYRIGNRIVDVEVAALASSTEPAGPFSVAFQHAERRRIEGLRAAVPRVDDYVILKTLRRGSRPTPSGARSRRRTARAGGVSRAGGDGALDPRRARAAARSVRGAGRAAEGHAGATPAGPAACARLSPASPVGPAHLGMSRRQARRGRRSRRGLPCGPFRHGPPARRARTRRAGHGPSAAPRRIDGRRRATRSPRRAPGRRRGRGPRCRSPACRGRPARPRPPGAPVIRPAACTASPPARCQPRAGRRPPYTASACFVQFHPSACTNAVASRSARSAPSTAATACVA